MLMVMHWRYQKHGQTFYMPPSTFPTMGDHGVLKALSCASANSNHLTTIKELINAAISRGQHASESVLHREPQTISVLW